VKAGDTGAAAHARMADLVADMAERADHILVACTELSLLTDGLEQQFTDSLDCLVQAIFSFATSGPGGAKL
jgi:aspartate racemase